jgi:hypothetical protein
MTDIECSKKPHAGMQFICMTNLHTALSERLCNIAGFVLLKGTVSLTNTISYF